MAEQMRVIGDNTHTHPNKVTDIFKQRDRGGDGPAFSHIGDKGPNKGLALCVICCQDRDKSYAEYFAEEDRPAGKAEGTCHLCWGPSLVDSYYPPFPELCFTKVWEMEGEIDD